MQESIERQKQKAVAAEERFQRPKKWLGITDYLIHYRLSPQPSRSCRKRRKPKRGYKPSRRLFLALYLGQMMAVKLNGRVLKTAINE